MSSRVSGVFIFAWLATSLWAQSPTGPANPDLSQEAFVFDHLNETVRFDNDGSGVRETTAVIRINSQAGVQAFGQLVFGYSTANEDLTIDYVRVRKADGHVVDTPISTVQDFAPEVLREAPMYSDYRQRHVSVVDLRPGVTLEYHVIYRVKPLAPGEFWYEYGFPRNWALSDGTLQIEVPKARQIKLKSPERKYEMREEGDRRIYVWSVKNFVPKRQNREDEEEDEDTPDVQLSSFTDWQQVSRWYAKLQSERAVPDENIKKKVAELTGGVASREEKTRRLYSFVAQNIRYVSLSFGVGRYQPHAASEVLQNGYGDCKDKHTLLQAMLAAEGIRSYPVLIHSGRKLDADLPSPAQFDHVITAVKLGENFDWLDSTTEVAPYGLIAYPLRNKQAVVASSDSVAGLRRTPAEVSVKSATVLSVKARVSELGALDADVEMTATGDNDWPVRGIFRRLPEVNWPQALELTSRAWGLPGDVSEVHIQAMEDTAKPLHVNYHLHKADYFKVPNPGASFQLLPPILGIGALRTSKKHASESMDVGPAGERLYRVHVEFPANFSVHDIPTDVRIARDYGEYSSSYKFSKNILDAERHMILRVNELPAMKRADYASFHNVVTSAVEQTPWCSIGPPSTSALASAGEMKGTAAELRDAGKAALRRQDFNTAATLLQRATDQDPNSKEGWDELGQAYAGLNQHEKSARAFQQEIEKDPYHAHANAELAAELRQLGRYDEAVAAYRKQIENAPSEKLSHKQLGLLLVQLKRDHEAQSELETAASIPPEDPEVKMALAQLYARTGETKKADVLMTSLTGGTVAVGGNDFFAPSLREDTDPNQAAHDAQKNLNALGDQFESGEYDRLDANAFSSMDLVALSWARMGWAQFLQGDNLRSWQFLEAAWELSQSGTVANRLARIFEKTGARDRAQHMYALAVAAGGPDAESSRQQVMKLNPANADKELSQAATELHNMRVVTLPRLVSQTASARFALMFDNSKNPERVQFIDGDESLRAVGDKLQGTTFPVKFPDMSSIKIILMGTVSCDTSGCNFEVQPLNSVQSNRNPRLAAGSKKP